MSKFGKYGGQYVAETLMQPLAELEAAFNKYKDEKEFIDEYTYYLKNYVGRETPLYYAEKLTATVEELKFILPEKTLTIQELIK